MVRRFIGYEMHDLVQLAAGDVVGVIVDIGKDTCRVLTNQVSLSTIAHRALKFTTRRFAFVNLASLVILLQGLPCFF